MGRPRTPTEILERRGAFKHDPQRGRARDGEPSDLQELGDPPAHITGNVLDAWCDIVNASHEGVLSDADSIALEMAAHLLAGFRAKPESFAVSKLTRLEGLLSKFGMTPADRSRVTVRSKQVKNKFADLKNRERPKFVSVPTGKPA